MKYSLDKQEKHTLFTLEEEKLDSALAPNLKSDLITLCAEGHNHLVMDLAKVKYIDSSGLSALLIGHRVCAEGDGAFAIARPNEHVLKLIEISQLQNVMEVHRTVEEAIDAVLMSSLERDLGAEDEQED